MTPAEGVKRAAQALSLLWPFAVIAAVSFGRMSLLLAAGLPLFAFQAIFTLRKGIAEHHSPRFSFRLSAPRSAVWGSCFLRPRSRSGTRCL